MRALGCGAREVCNYVLGCGANLRAYALAFTMLLSITSQQTVAVTMVVRCMMLHDAKRLYLSSLLLCIHITRYNYA